MVDPVTPTVDCEVVGYEKLVWDGKEYARGDVVRGLPRKAFETFKHGLRVLDPEETADEGEQFPFPEE